MLVATLCERLVKVTTPLTAVRFVVPCKAPLPPRRLAATTVVLSLLRRFPNWSSIRITGCGAKAAPAVAVLAGCVRMVSLLAAAGLTTTLEEVAPAKLPLLKLKFVVPGRIDLQTAEGAHTVTRRRADVHAGRAQQRSRPGSQCQAHQLGGWQAGRRVVAKLVAAADDRLSAECRARHPVRGLSYED